MSAGPRFRYSTITPAGPASALVEEFWVLDAERCRMAIEVALPDTAVEIYFNLGPVGRRLFQHETTSGPSHRSAWVAGPRDRPVLIAKETRDCQIVGARLKPGAACALLGVPVKAGASFGSPLFFRGLVPPPPVAGREPRFPVPRSPMLVRSKRFGPTDRTEERPYSDSRTSR